MDRSKIVVVETFRNYYNAELHKALLDDAGIESRLLNETNTVILPLGDDNMEIKLIVREEDEKRAREILAAKFDKEEFAEESTKKRRPSDDL